MKDNSKSVDNYIGQKIRERRNQLQLSQAELGNMLGVSAQQIQRYESAENGIALAKLPLLASVLNVKPNFFTDEMPKNEMIGSSSSGIIRRGLNRPLRILLIEDDVNDVLLFQNALMKCSRATELQHIQNSGQVLKQLSRCDASSYPDIILLDINMPGTNGIELLQDIKQSSHKKLPVIMFTNSMRSKDMLACYDHFASGFVQKSADLQQFYSDVESITEYWGCTLILPTRDSQSAA